MSSEITPIFSTDVAPVVANDVVNPDARQLVESIAGMPILEVDRAKMSSC
jgi:NAD/NADP transhydrogenase beta subunit